MAEVAIVMAVIAGLNLCLATFKEFREVRKERKDSKAAKALDRGLDRELEYTSKRIVSEKAGLEKWIMFTENRSDKQPAVSASFERDIKHRLDLILKQQGSFKKDMEQLRQLLEKDDESSMPQINKLSALIKIKTRKIKGLATTQYKQMSIGLWNLEALAELPDHKIRQFCPGALRLQNRKLPNFQIADIAEDYNTKEGEFICRYCSLQVGDARSGAESQTEEWRLLLAKSHLMGSASFEDFRALYKCLPCYMAHEDKDFGSVDILRAHILSVHGDVDMQTLKTKMLEEEELEEEDIFETGERPDELADSENANPSHETESNDKIPDENGSEASMEGREATKDDGRFRNDAEWNYHESRPRPQDGGSDSSLPVEPSLQTPLWPSGGARVQKNRAIDPMRKKKSCATKDER